MNAEESGLDYSPTIGAIGAALAKAQAEMPDARFDSKNPFLGFGYASLSAVRAVTVVMAAHGIAVVQGVTVDTDKRVVVTTMLVHSSGEWFRSSLALRPEKDTPQGCGSAITYARRYALSAMAGISSADDDGTEASNGQRHSAPPANTKSVPAAAPVQPAPATTAPTAEPVRLATEDQIATLSSLILQHGISVEDARKALDARKVKALSELSQVQASEMIGRLQSRPRPSMADSVECRQSITPEAPVTAGPATTAPAPAQAEGLAAPVSTPKAKRQPKAKPPLEPQRPPEAAPSEGPYMPALSPAGRADLIRQIQESGNLMDESDYIRCLQQSGIGNRLLNAATDSQLEDAINRMSQIIHANMPAVADVAAAAQ